MKRRAKKLIARDPVIMKRPAIECLRRRTGARSISATVLRPGLTKGTRAADANDGGIFLMLSYGTNGKQPGALLTFDNAERLGRLLLDLAEENRPKNDAPNLPIEESPGRQEDAA